MSSKLNGKLNRQQTNNQQVEIKDRLLKHKRRRLAGITTMALVAGITATIIFNNNERNTFKEDNIVAPAHATVDQDVAQSALTKNYVQLPLQFEQNIGQAPDSVQYISRGSGYTLFLTPTETVLTLKDKSSTTPAVIRTSLINANVPIKFNGNTTLPGKVNYLIGRDESNWLTGIPTFMDVIAKQIYPGIDLRYHGNQRQLEYDFIVAPGINPDVIQMQFSGVDLLALGEAGQLVIKTEHGTLQHKKPIVYQVIDHERIQIKGEYQLADNNTVGFKLGAYDPEYELVIDPILDYSTYLGAEANDRGLAIAVDDAGNAYIAGTTVSANFPLVNAYQTSLNGSRDTFIAKLNADGNALVYSTYLGGSGDEDDDDNDDGDDDYGEDENDDNDEGDSDADTGKDIAVDANGNLYITGSTNSNLDFPIINAVQTSYGGGDRDAYVAKLSADGSSLLFSTYLGGSKKDKGFGIALNNNGDVFVTGRTKSNDFPTVNPYQASHAGNGDAYVVKLAGDGSQINYATYLGGSKSDTAKAIAIDSQGNATITGVTKSKNDFPLQNALQPSFGGGGRDAYVTQFNASGSALNYSTYLGGSKKDKGRGIAIDSQNNAIVVGMTKSNNDFPLQSALQTSYGGGSDDGFISKLTANGSALSFSTYIGGGKTDKLRSVAVDNNDDIYIVGTTKSTTGIPTVDAIQANLSGSKRDAFVTKLSSDGSSVIYGTYLGGTKNDRGKDIAVDGQDAYITGVTKSDLDFPIANALQSLFGGGSKDAFVAKIADDTANQDPVITSSPVTEALVGQLYTYDVEANDPDNDTLIYSLQIFPAGMTIDANTGLISWTPNVVGIFNVTVQVDDGNNGTATQSYTITVTDPDVTAPTITITSPQDGLITNQANQTIIGTLDEAATLTLNGNPVTVNPDLSFSVAVTLVEGSNIFNFEATDAANNVGTTTLTLTLDTVAPVITITSPQDGLVTNQATQTITGNLSETATLTINGQAVTVNPDLTFSSNVTLVEGANIIATDATDAANNVGNASLTLNLDTIAPVITITSPQDGLVTNQATQTITGNLSETATLTINGQAVTVNPDLTFSSDVTLVEGANAISIEATDDATNVGNASLTLNLDTVAPVITVTAPQDGLITNQAAQTITGTLSETATLTINGQAVTVNPDNTFSFAVTLSEGQNSFTLEATDAATNVGNASLNLNLDTVAPVTTITTPADGLLTNNPTQLVTGSVSETASLTINGQAVTLNPDNTFSFGPITLIEGANTITAIATDTATNSSTTTVNVSVDTIAPVISVTSPVDGALTNQNQIAVIGSLSELGNLSINGQATTVNPDGSFSTTVSLVEGANTITLTASDAATNASQTQLTVISDTIAPVITVTNPINGSTTNQVAQLVTGSLSEAATLTINGQAATVNPDNTFSFGPINLSEGANTITLSATDAATNNSTGVVNVTLDTVVPVLTLDSPAGDILTNQTTVTFSGNVSEAVTLTINGQAVSQNPDNTFSANITVAEGANVVAVIATDAGGNTATQNVNVTVDTTPPATPDTNLINRGNPLNGIVMVTGLPGSVEANTLVHVVNPSNSFEARVLAESDGSFSTDVGGFANDTFTIFTVDAAGNTSAPAVLIPNPPLALTLDPIGNKLAPLGQITRFTVTANDSEGNPITLGLTPLPLLAGMNYNIATGEFSFRPTNGQEGDYDLTFSALSGDERVVETVTVSVPAPNPADPTDLTGRILDANSMQGGTIIPVVGATVSFLGTGISTTTDAQGFFTLSGLPANAEVIDINASTAQAGPGGVSYADFREQFRLATNVTNIVERPFYLPRLATESLTTVDPAQTTIVENTTLGLSLNIAAGNAINDADGQPFTGQVSISEVPRNLAPDNLPEIIDPTLLFTIQPVGVSYTVPAPITVANTEGHTPNSEVDIWSVDPDLGQFVIVGTGQVSADGSEIVTISGGIRANDWHAIIPPQADPGPNDDNPDEDNPCPVCPMEEGSSMFSLNDGHMGLQFSLQPYRSLEASRALTFSYRSFRAHPQPSILFNGINNVRSTVPATISYELEVANLIQGQEVFLDTSGFSESLNEPFSTAISFNASDFDSGMYDYRLKVTSNFSGGTRRTNIIEGDVMVVNEQQSPFGAGWMLEGLFELTFNLDNSVTLIAPSGRSINYLPDAAPDTFISPDNDYAVFVRNPDGSYTHTEKDGVKMHFNAEGQITEHEDRNNNITAYAYDTEGKLETITDPVGLVTTFVYDNNGLLQTVTDPASRVSMFEYDAAGNLTKITYPDNTFETFEYDDRHLMTAHEDERQNRFTDRYDTFGRIIDGTLPDGTVRAAVGRTSTALVDVSSGIGTQANPAPVVRPDDVGGDYTDGRGNPSNKELDSHGRATMEMDEIGRITLHQRDADSNPTQTTRPIGSVVTRTFDNFGNVLTQREEFNGATTTYTYDQFSLVTSVTNPRNHTTTITRDPADGNPLTIVNHLGHTTTMVYDSRGLVTSMTSPNGLVTTYTYNTEGLMDTKTETPPVGSPGNVRVWTYTYFPTGLLQTVNTPDNITLNYTYDNRSFLTSVTDNLNQSITYTYDNHKNVTKTETRSSDGSLALLVDNIYDNRNRLVQTKAPHVGIEESITQRTLDANSNLIGLIDPNGNASSNTYDAFNRLDTNTHRENGVTDYTYDDQDRITKVIAPNGVTTDYEYDIISRRTKEISPDRGTISYTYDLANNVTTITEGRGIVATMTYDGLERVATKTYPNTIAGKNENVTYTYDTCSFGLGFLCNRVDESGTTNYNYDAYGNMTDSTFTEIEGTVYSMSYVYDDGDHVIQATYPSGRVVDYARDGVRRINGIDTTLNGSAQNVINNIQYRGDNQVTQCTFGNGLIDTRSYDLQGRLLNQTLEDALSTIIDDRTYTYDKNSNVLSIDTNVEDNAYTYDKLDRLLSDGIDSNSPFDYTYDLNDNRLTKQLQDASFDEVLSYVSNSNRILDSDALQVGVTPIPAVPNRDLVFNDVGRLFQLIEEGTLKAEYFYNDEGQRTRKVNYQADGITVDSITIYHYDHMGYLITETDETGALIKDYIWTEGMIPVAQIDNNGGTESIIYLYTDHLMTNRLATDDTQAVVWRWEGEAFGNTLAQELGSVSVNLRFPGQYFDAESNLFYNVNRYYDPTLSRYITSDPVGISAGLNTYSYAKQNSLSFMDILGLEITGKFRADGFIPKVTDWEYLGLTEPDGGMRRDGLQDIYGQANFSVSGALNAAVDCKETDECGDVIREWSLDGSVPVNNLEFSFPLKEPTIPIPHMGKIILLDKIIRASQFMGTWKSMILNAGKALLNSPDKICQGHSFARTILD